MLAFSPASATKDPKKGRTAVVGAGEDGSQDEGMQESDICDSINTADIHEIVVTRVNETLPTRTPRGSLTALSSSS